MPFGHKLRLNPDQFSRLLFSQCLCNFHVPRAKFPRKFLRHFSRKFCAKFLRRALPPFVGIRQLFESHAIKFLLTFAKQFCRPSPFLGIFYEFWRLGVSITFVFSSSCSAFLGELQDFRFTRSFCRSPIILTLFS
jgi:hypothetical protein